MEKVLRAHLSLRVITVHDTWHLYSVHFDFSIIDCLQHSIASCLCVHANTYFILGLLYFGFSIFSLICASRHINKAKQDKYQALNSDEMAELNTPYAGDSSYGSTGDQSPDMEQKKDTL